MSRSQVISALQTLFHLGEDECAKIYAKAQAGGEFQNETEAPLWLEERLKPNLVWIKGKKHFMVQTWGGPLQAGDLEKIAAIEGITGQVKFEGIGEFSHSNAYLFNCGQLRWQAQDWQKHVIERL
jgi:hypothetical protein